MDTAHNQIQNIQSHLNILKEQALALQKRNSKLNTNNKNLIKAIGLTETATNEQIKARVAEFDWIISMQLTGPTLLKDLKNKVEELQGELTHVKSTSKSYLSVLSQTREALGLPPAGPNIIEEAKRLKEKVKRLEEQIKEQARENAILRGVYRRPSIKENEIAVEFMTYSALLRDSADLKVIKEKLGIDS